MARIRFANWIDKHSKYNNYIHISCHIFTWSIASIGVIYLSASHDWSANIGFGICWISLQIPDHLVLNWVLFFMHIAICLFIIICLCVSLFLYFAKTAKNLAGFFNLMRKQVRLLLFILHVISSQTLLLVYRGYIEVRSTTITESLQAWEECLLLNGSNGNCPPPILVNFSLIVLILVTFATIGLIGALIMGFSYRTLKWYKIRLRQILNLIFGEKIKIFALEKISSGTGDSTGTTPAPPINDNDSFTANSTTSIIPDN